MNNDPEEAELPEEIALAAYDGNFERVKAWLAGGSASDPRSINATNDVGWTLLMNIATSDAMTPEHVEFARYLISRGAAIDTQSFYRTSTALHFACLHCSEAVAALVSVLVAGGANVNLQTYTGVTPLFMIKEASEWTLHIVTTLLRAGASLDSSSRSFEEHLNHISGPYAEHKVAIVNLVASVRAAGSWKSHCRLAHKEVLRLRSLVARGRVKLPSRTRRRSPRGRDVRQKRALEFVLRQGDNGIVWTILSFWRATA